MPRKRHWQEGNPLLPDIPNVLDPFTFTIYKEHPIMVADYITLCAFRSLLYNNTTCLILTLVFKEVVQIKSENLYVQANVYTLLCTLYLDGRFKVGMIK